MADFITINTQEEFDERIKERLSRQKESIESKYEGFEAMKKENESLKTQIGELNKAIESGKTTVEGLNTQIADLTGKVTEYELANLKTTIALENGIPYELASRLVGNDKETLKEDARKLSGLIRTTGPKAPPRVNPTVADGEKESLLQTLRNVTGKNE